MPFEHTVTARFFEIDRVGIVFFGRFFEYCHVTFEELLAQATGGIEASLRQGWGLPLVHASADFKAPVRLGDRLRVVVELEQRSTRSLTFGYQIFGPDNGLRATCRLVHACVELATMTACAVPHDLIEALERAGLQKT